DEQRAVSFCKDSMTAVGAIDRGAVEDRGSNDDVLSGFESDAKSDRCVGKDRRPPDTALRELGTDAKGAVDEESGGLQAIKLRVQVVAADQRGEPVLKQILLEPRFVELRSRRALEITHSLGVADQIARVAAVVDEAVEKQGGSWPAQEAITIERQHHVKVA